MSYVAYHMQRHCLLHTCCDCPPPLEICAPLQPTLQGLLGKPRVSPHKQGLAARVEVGALVAGDVIIGLWLGDHKGAHTLYQRSLLMAFTCTSICVCSQKSMHITSLACPCGRSKCDVPALFNAFRERVSKTQFPLYFFQAIFCGCRRVRRAGAVLRIPHCLCAARHRAAHHRLGRGPASGPHTGRPMTGAHAVFFTASTPACLHQARPVRGARYNCMHAGFVLWGDWCSRATHQC